MAPLLRVFPYEALRERWETKTDIRSSDDCWPWLSVTSKQGYGKLVLQHSRERFHLLAHRLSNYLATREEPDEVVRHLCHNPPCQNPNHLKSGTYAENQWDKFDVTPEMAIELRRVFLPQAEYRGKTYTLRPNAQKLATDLGMSDAALSRILNKQTYDLG